MDLNEARKVVWIGSNRRPLGELLDIGYLNKERLIWAVEHVKEPTVQQAAAVLLSWLSQSAKQSGSRKRTNIETGQNALPGFELKISLEKAKEVIWPFSPYKGEAMGVLVESRKLTLNNLVYAIDNAWDSRVRDAAIALMAVRLRQIAKEPEPSKGHLHIVSKGRSYAERMQLILVYFEGMIPGLALGALLYYLVTSLFFSKPPTSNRTIGEVLSTPSGVIFFIVGLLFWILVIIFFFRGLDWSENQIEKQVENYRRGKEGEDRVANVINATLNGEWTLFKNVYLPGRKGGDLDAVLVGPPGVWVLKIKNLAGQYKNDGNEWEYRSAKNWKRMKKDPSDQARKNAARLGEFLEADDIRQWVKSAVIWANSDSPISVKNQSVAVWPIDRLEDELGNIVELKGLSDAFRQKICEKLTKLIERQKS